MLYAYYKENTINYVSITRVNCINHRSDLAAEIKRRLPSVSLVKNEGVVAPQRSCPKAPKPPSQPKPPTTPRVAVRKLEANPFAGYFFLQTCA